jgi:thiol:disulfide interchange protein
MRYGAALLLSAVMGLAGVSARQPTKFPEPMPEKPPGLPTTPIRPTQSSSAAARTPRLIAFKTQAGWCVNCKAMGTLFTDLTRRFDGESVLFVSLDLTDQAGRTQSEFTIGAMNLPSVWGAIGQGKKTGTIEVVDLSTRRVVATIPHDATFTSAESAIGDALKK